MRWSLSPRCDVPTEATGLGRRKDIWPWRLEGSALAWGLEATMETCAITGVRDGKYWFIRTPDLDGVTHRPAG